MGDVSTMARSRAARSADIGQQRALDPFVVTALPAPLLRTPMVLHYGSSNPRQCLRWLRRWVTGRPGWNGRPSLP